MKQERMTLEGWWRNINKETKLEMHQWVGQLMINRGKPYWEENHEKNPHAMRKFIQRFENEKITSKRFEYIQSVYKSQESIKGTSSYRDA